MTERTRIHRPRQQSATAAAKERAKRNKLQRERPTLDDVVAEMALKIAASPMIAVKLARRVISHLAEPDVRTSMADEMIFQTMLNKSADYAEFRAARAEGREPNFTGS